MTQPWLMPFLKHIRIVHDQVGVYSDWYQHGETMSMRDARHCHDYFEGKSKPNYPVPATTKNALIAAPYVAITPISKRYILNNYRD